MYCNPLFPNATIESYDLSFIRFILNNSWSKICVSVIYLVDPYCIVNIFANNSNNLTNSLLDFLSNFSLLTI